MKRRAILALLLAGLGGCKQILGFEDPTVAPDAEPATDDGYLSGARLKLRWNDYSGTRQFVAVYDAQLDETCQPTLWADGKTYCMPRSGGIGYSDDACTNPVGLRSKLSSGCLAAPRYFSATEVRPCNEFRRARLFRSAMLLPATSYFTKNQSGGCDGPNPSSNYEVYQLSPEVPTTELVELTQTAQTMGRIEQRGFRGADGSRLPSELYDTTLETACQLSSTGTCAPVGATPNGFADANCAEPLGARLSGCPTPTYGARARRPGCPDAGIEYFSLGAQVDLARVYQSISNNACVSNEPSPGYSYFAPGPAVMAATLARTNDTAPGRQIQRVYYTDATAKVRSATLFDTAHNADCITVGGRCLPQDASVQRYYADITCMTPVDVAIVFTGPAGCGLPATPRYALRGTASAEPCAPNYEVFRVGGQHSGTLFSKSEAGACSPASVQNGLYYDVEKSLPLSEFATATVITDP